MFRASAKATQLQTERLGPTVPCPLCSAVWGSQTFPQTNQNADYCTVAGGTSVSLLAGGVWLRPSRHLYWGPPVSQKCLDRSGAESWHLRANLGPSFKPQGNKDLTEPILAFPTPYPFFFQRKMKESDNYFYLPPNCTNYQPISSQCDRHQLWKTHRDKLALIGFPLAV